MERDVKPAAVLRFERAARYAAIACGCACCRGACDCAYLGSPRREKPDGSGWHHGDEPPPRSAA
jgi:hypothetical protein